jgi:hypothetical protein
MTRYVWETFEVATGFHYIPQLGEPVDGKRHRYKPEDLGHTMPTHHTPPWLFMQHSDKGWVFWVLGGTRTMPVPYTYMENVHNLEEAKVMAVTMWRMS